MSNEREGGPEPKQVSLRVSQETFAPLRLYSNNYFTFAHIIARSDILAMANASTSRFNKVIYGE
jgi:hypothetical protein